MGVLLVCWHRGDGHPGSIQAPSWLLSPGLVSCFGSGVQFGGGAGARGGDPCGQDGELWCAWRGLCVYGESEMPLEVGDGL